MVCIELILVSVSVIVEAMLAKSPVSSLATILICAVKYFPADSPQFTGKHCSGFFLKGNMFLHLSWCTTRPFSAVKCPITESPGIGLQQGA